MNNIKIYTEDNKEVIEISINLGTNGGGTRIKFYFRETKESYLATTFREFIPGEQGRRVTMRVEVPKTEDREALLTSIHKAWREAYTKNILELQIEEVRESLKKLETLKILIKEKEIT